jgi:hypothetical protein
MSPTSSSTFQLVMHKTVPTQTATKLGWTKLTELTKPLQHRKTVGSAHPTEKLANRSIQARMSPTSSSTFQFVMHETVPTQTWIDQTDQID